MTPITLDYANMVAPNLTGAGIDPERLGMDLAERFREAYESVDSARASGEMGFFQLPYASETLARTQELADGYGQWFENVVILGIGGSALGARTLRDALLGPLWNEMDDVARDHFPRIYVLDNVDPHTVHDLLGHIDIRRSLFNVVSKSGSTAETMALYLVLEGLLIDEVGPEKARGHFLFTTDPSEGPLRAIAEAEGIPSLPIPPNVGGRFSVLSPVGLLPAAVAGIDVAGLLAGAARVDDRCRTPVLRENPAGLMATLLHTAHSESQASIHVMMPYSNRLRSFSAWFQQIWAESLGKAHDLTGRPVHTGPTPLPALGVTDQHSQLQLFMEGPRDKVVMFVAVTGDGADQESEDLEIAAHRSGMQSVGYLAGHGLGELLNIERQATAEALRREGRPSMTFEIDTLDAESLGELFMLVSIATVYAGALYGVNPLDQPGVELSKELTYGLMGRSGHDVPVLPAADPRWRV
jgi:glucose-6-phosphate isomerase